MNVLDGEELDVDVSHGGVDDGTVRHSLGALGLRGRHHLFLRGLLVKDVSVRVGALCVLRFSLCELQLQNWYVEVRHDTLQYSVLPSGFLTM